jgi:amino acid adenylation domain-containing protein
MGIDNLTARLADLSPAKRVLLELRLKQRALDSGLKQTIPRRRITSSAPLSFAQQRLWFLDQYEPNSSVYNIPSALRLRGSLNIGALEQSLNEIIRRHESLRTTFSMVDGNPLQVIAPVIKLSFAAVDLRDHPERDREEEAQRLAQEEARRSFDLRRGPPFRATLFRLGEQDHLLLLTAHHIVSDGWSTGIFYRELSVLYRAFTNGEPSPLMDLPVQYADFAVWQREWFQGEVLEKQLSYWKNQLGRIPGVLHLPTDRPRPAVQSYRGKTQSIDLSKELTEGIKALSRKEGVTLFMTLLAAFQTLLYRYSGQKDIVVGSPIANRNRAEIEGLIGFFVNTLVLRTDLSGNPTFRKLLQRVRTTALGAYEHQDLPFESLVEELKPERSLSHSPLFQVMFVLQNAPGNSLKFERLSVSPLRISAETAKCDLTLSMRESVDGLKGSLQYNTDLFDEETIIRMLGHFRVLLEGVVGDPNQRLASLPMLTQAEKQQTLGKWNVTKREYPRDRCIHELFEAQVDRSPDAVAVVCEGRQLTYRELNCKANQLAHYLKKHGVGSEVLVAICIERSLEMVIGLLGILKAGGAYVPLDPDYPTERLGFLLKDMQTSVLLSQERLITRLPESCARAVCLDRDWREIAEHGGENPISLTTPESLAYVIYTSGSTGQPKGVEVPHRGVLRLLFGVEYVQLDESETFLHLAAISFDASTFELWGALLHGAKCVLFSGKIPSAHELGNILHDHGISTLWLTASLFNTVIDEAPGALSGVRQLLIGGEALSVPHVRRAVTLLPHTRIINGYGPTESTTFACCYDIPARLGESINSIPIGRPIANTEVYLLDYHLSPVPSGVPGELYIGGDGLVRGYLNRPDLTAENFIPHPFGEPGARLYKTGDLARYLSDGNIEFLDRIDDQVKIRGFRIELGEIESVLGQHPGVRETVVLACEDMPGIKRLVAYVVPFTAQACSTRELRTFVKRKLPEYMIPSAFVLLDLLPLTSHGKVDRALFPPVDQNRPELEASYVAPRTLTEKRLVEIWSKLLGLNQVGIRDNFFDLGGHSLLAVRLFAEIEKTFKTRPPLSSLFQEATIESLANVINQENKSTAPPSLLAIQPQGSKLPFFCVHEFFGDVLCYLNLARHLGDDQPFYALQPRGLEGADEPFTDVVAMAAYYVDIVRRVQPRGPYALGGLCFGGIIAFEMAQQLQAKGETVALVALLDSGIGLNVDRFQWWWRFFQNLPWDFRSWMIGSLQLTGAQWLEVVKIKTAVAKGQVEGIFRLSAGGCQPNDIPAGLKRLGDVFQFSDRHQRVARAQYRALRNYKPQRYTGRLTLFRARMQPFFSSHDAHKGWSRVAAGGVNVKNIPGNHLGMLQEPHVQVLARELSACLEKASRETSGQHV